VLPILRRAEFIAANNARDMFVTWSVTDPPNNTHKHVTVLVCILALVGAAMLFALQRTEAQDGSEALATQEMVTYPPKNDPQVMLEQWIEGRQGDEEEAVYPQGESPTLRRSLSALYTHLKKNRWLRWLSCRNSRKTFERSKA